MGLNLGQILGGITFIAGVLLAPVTGGASLLIAGFGVLQMTAATAVPAIPYLTGQGDTPPPSQDTGSSGTTRPDLRGASNKLNNWGKVPLVVGKHYLAPPLAGKQYTEIAGSDGADQYLHVCYILGYGPAAVRNIKIGDNLLASNSSGAMGALTVDGQAFISGGTPVVQAELRYDSTAMTYYPSRITEDQLGGGIQMRSPAGTPTMLYRMTAPGCTAIAVDIEFPNGLIKGSSSSASVQFKAEYIDPATETWSTPHAITDTTLTKTLNTTGRYSYSISGLTAKTYQVRVYRVTADATDSTIRDTCYWTALRSTIGTQAPIKASLAAKIVRLSMRVKASDNISGSIGSVSAEVSPKIPIYSGTGTGRASWTTVAETSNPSAIALYLLRGDATGDGIGVGPNPSPRVDANIDYPAFEALYQWVAARNTAGKPNWCNAVFDSGSTTREMLVKVLSTCRAQIIKRGNIVSVVQDIERTTPVALINQRNSWGYQGSKQFPDIPHGYRVGFINANAGWQADVRIVLADGYLYDTDNDGNLRDAWGTIRAVGGGYALATKLESIERWGLTDPDEVFREARATLAALTLRPEVHTVTQDWEALGYQYGDLVRFGHDVPEFGLIGGRVESVVVDGSGNALSIITDELVTMETGKSYSLCYKRASDGRVLYAALNTVVGSTRGATFTTPIAPANSPAVDDLYHYGEGAEGGTVPMIIVGLEPGGDHSTTVHMQDYGAGIFTSDTGTIPAFVSNISIPVAQDFAMATRLRQIAATAAEQTAAAATAAATAIVPVTPFMQNLPPSNNITALALSYEANADGAVNVDVSWSYTQGTVTADGFLVYYKSATSAPGAIDLVLDPSIYIKATDTATAYAMTIPGLPVRYGGAGAVSRHYRFAVIAVGTRAGGTIPCNTGGDATTHVVEDSAWIDKTFVANIALSEGYNSLNIEGQSIVFRNVTTGVELARIQYNDANGLLQISKLAHLVHYRGSWLMGTWGAYSVIESVSSRDPSMVVLPDGRIVCIYIDYTTNYIKQKIRDTSGTWGSVLIIESVSSYHPSIAILSDGSVVCVYRDNTTGYLRQKIRDTSGTWGSYSVVESNNADNPSLVVMADGSIVCVYRDVATNYLRQKIRDTSGAWGAYSIIESAGSAYPSLTALADGSIVCVYRDLSTNYLRQKVRDASASWGAYSVIESSVSDTPRISTLPDGRILCVYQDGATTYLRQKIRDTSGTWGSYSVVESVSSYYPSVISLPDGRLLCVYRDGSTGYLRQKIDTSAYSSIPIADTYEESGPEVGQNLSGTWIKFGDGTMIATYKVTTAALPSNTWAYLFYNYPTPFISTPDVSVTGSMGSAWTGTISIMGIGHATQWEADVYPGSTGQVVNLTLIAVGRWK